MKKSIAYLPSTNQRVFFNRERSYVKWILFIFLFHSMLSAQTIDKQKIDKYIQYFEEHNGGMGTLSLFKGGVEVYNRSFGQQFMVGSFNPTTRYNIGSVTKMFTATLTIKLIDDNKFRLEDKLSDFFPSVPNANKITIKNLLEHTSGLGDYTVKNNKLWLNDSVNDSLIFDEIKEQGVLFQPGERVHYSNTAYYLLAKIIEQKYGDTYSNIIQREIAGPLNLKTLESSQNDVSNVYPPYAFANCKWAEAKDLCFDRVVGAGDLISTPTDLNLFIIGLFNNKILKHPSIELMKPHDKEIFGRGMVIWPYKNLIFFGHGGDTSCTHSFVFYNEDSDVAIAFSLITNRYRHKSFAKDIMDIIYGENIVFPKFTCVVHRSEALDKYEGTYVNENFPIKLVIEKDHDRLIISGGAVLDSYEENKFRNEGIGVNIEFEPSKNILYLMQDDHKLEFSKE